MQSKEFKFRPILSLINLNRTLWDLTQKTENVPILIGKLVPKLKETQPK